MTSIERVVVLVCGHIGDIIRCLISDRLSIGKDEVGRVSDTQVTVRARGHFISFHPKDYADIAS